MRRAVLFPILLAVLHGCSGAGESSSGGGAAPGGGAGGGAGAGGAQAPTALPRAAGIAIPQVALYQGVKVTLFDQGVEVTERTAPVVAGRPGLLRVFFQMLPEWQPREIIVRLRLSTSAGEMPPMEIRGTPQGDSSDADLISTANFDIPAEAFTGDLSYSVELLEVAPGVTAPGSTLGSAMPAEGKAQFHEESTGGSLKLVVLPIRYNADGSGRVPDVSDAKIAEFRIGMLKLYPAADVEVQVADVLDWSSQVAPNGSGWQNLLDGVVNARKQAKVGKDVYYYGLFNPAVSIESYCSFGCAAGLTYISSNSFDPSVRASVGLGFPGPEAIKTMAHEVGHAHGRLHAPCDIPDPSSVDKGFPDKGGKLTGWGYDLVDRKLKAPGKTSDVMGYCDPSWVSDYTFSALFSRMKAVNAGGYEIGGARRAWQVASLDVGGELRWGERDELSAMPGGEAREVTLLDEEGEEVGRVSGYFYPMSHLPGGRLLLPDGTPKAAAVRLSGEGVFRR